MVKKGLRCLRKVNKLDLKIMKEKKSPFMIYENFDITLVPEDNGKQNSKESYTNKYQKLIVCIYGCLNFYK